MDIQGNTADFLAELDALRVAHGLSYQAVADSCCVSKTTVYRVLTGATEPTVQLVQSIAAAVQYKPPVQTTVPEEFTKDGYIHHLATVLQREREEKDRQVTQLRAHYNMLLAQERRTVKWLCAALALLISAFIFWLIIDVTHPTVGWIQRDVAYESGFMMDAVDWLEDSVWSV